MSSNNKSLEEAMVSLQEGNLDSFDMIYESTYQSIFFIIYGVLKDYHLAEDVSQNAYLRICEKIHLYKRGTNPKAWMATIARNLALNELRKLKKELIVDLDTIDYLEYTNNPTDVETPLIDLARANLSDIEFQILMLCTVNQYKRREAAKLLNMPISTVTWHYQRAIKKLRKLIKGGDHFEKG